jgi:hypothetical protein
VPKCGVKHRVNPEIHNIFIKRIGFTLIRVHRQQNNDDNDGGDNKSILLQNLKWPIEALFVGMRVKDYSQGTTAQIKQHLDKWHKFCSVTDTTRTAQGWKSKRATVETGVLIGSVLPLLTTSFTVAAPATNVPATLTAVGGIPNNLKPGSVLTWVNASTTATATATIASVSATGLVFTLAETGNALTAWDADELVAGVVTTATTLTTLTTAEAAGTVSVCAPTLKNVSIKAHGIPIYNNFPDGFYNAYLPLNYGGHNVKTPEDIGALMITFCLYPGSYQPSGHINVSRAREFYIDYSTTTLIGSGAGQSTGALVVVASAINFLLKIIFTIITGKVCTKMQASTTNLQSY